MKATENLLKDQLIQRKDIGTLRSLSSGKYPVDFCSNDYLGFARSALLREKIAAATADNVLNGSTGSRLLSGNTQFTEDTEQFIADFHQAEAGLIFNSGYDANLGLLSSIPKRGDTILTDELIHASLIDGARLSYADRIKFKHNNLHDLEQRLKTAKGNIYVVTESVYSMDGDLAPLTEITRLCETYQANLIVDEAHATGIFGPNGAGLVNELDLQDKIFARIVTFGKALGCHGAIVLGSSVLREYLINFARSFIYTTAAPFHNIAAVKCAYQLLSATDTGQIKMKIKYYNSLITDLFPEIPQYLSPVKTIILSGNTTTKYAAKSLQEKGMDVRPILSPTVPAGMERLRICLHTFNSDEDIKRLVQETGNLIQNE